MIQLPERAQRPTMYFIGVTTGSSSIMKLFPDWTKILAIDAQIKGIDLPLHADPADYRAVVEFIKQDPLSLGALVTTHKIDLYQAAKDLFDYLDPYAQLFSELSSISKKDGRLEGYAKDPITSGLALDAFLPRNYWQAGGDALILGAGGSAISVGAYILRQGWAGCGLPARLIVCNRSLPRLQHIEALFQQLKAEYHLDVKLEFHLTPEAEDNDRVLAGLRPHSLVINATGLGKDRPGSPLTNACAFPKDSYVWEFNYRGDLLFLHQAEAQKKEKHLHVENGWIYFLHGWTQVIAEVFHLDLTPERFRAIEKLSADLSGKPNQFDFALPFRIDFDLKNGLSKTAKATVRMLSQMKGMYYDCAAYEQALKEGDRPVYEFYELNAPEKPGDLAFGTSITYPGTVGDEYYMTKGHFHTILETGEVYYCLSGEGCMLMENPEGDVRVEQLTPGQALYVPPRYAHRSINTGETPLVTFFVFRADAGHDYGTIETKGYRRLVVKHGGSPKVIENPKWRKEV